MINSVYPAFSDVFIKEQILLEIQNFSLKKMHMKLSSAKMAVILLGLNLLSLSMIWSI